MASLLLRGSPSRAFHALRSNHPLLNCRSTCSYRLNGPLLGACRANLATSLNLDEESPKMSKKKKEKSRKAERSARRAEGADETTEGRLDQLIDACLDAPTPVRHVKLKERLREKEMEKFGLMTRERQREVEQEKAREKAKKKGAAGGEDDEKILDTAEGMRLAKEYSRTLMRDARKRAAGETLRLRLKQEAIAALPPHLREAAMVPDFTPFPGLFPATLTPPIPGYSHRFEESKSSSTEDS